MRGLRQQPHILLVEDDLSLGEALASILSSEGYRVSCSRTGDEGCALALSEAPDVVITDLRLAGMGGLDLVRNVRHALPATPVILMTAHGSPETIIESTKEGVFDYLGKPFEIEQLLEVVRRSLSVGRTLGPPAGPHAHGLPGFVGRGSTMEALYKDIGRLAPRPINVLIRGETGTGKELVARALHAHSGRAKKPFVAVNCAALSETLLESELFGHERGAFTGAIERRIGRFEQAADGTLFLDEIGEMSSSTQAKLLRVLQEGAFERVGGRQSIFSNARVLAATHVDIDAAMAARSFREDLFYRLSQASIVLPPLREHPEDIPDIARHFVQMHASRMGCPPIELHDDVLEVLASHAWPGNVRELENVVRQLLIRANGHSVGVADVLPLVRAAGPGATEEDDGMVTAVRKTLDAVERGEVVEAHALLVRKLESTLLSEAMARAQSNQSQVARWLGISRVTLREKLRGFGLHPETD